MDAGIIQRVRMTVRLCVSIVLVLGVTPPSLAGFVRLAGRQLVLDGSPFYFVGMNSYWMPSTAAFGDTGSVDKVMARAQVCWGTTPQASILAKTARDALVRQHVAAEPQLKWLRAQEPPCPWDGETCGWAARGGHLEVLRWARAQYVGVGCGCTAITASTLRAHRRWASASCAPGPSTTSCRPHLEYTMKHNSRDWTGWSKSRESATSNW